MGCLPCPRPEQHNDPKQTFSATLPARAFLDRLCTILCQKNNNEIALFVAPEPFFDSLTGGNRELNILIHRTHIRAGALEGEVWVAGFGPTDICAVAVWFGPGTDILAT